MASAHPEKTPPSPRSAQSYGDIVANIIRVSSVTAPPVAEVGGVRSAAAVSAVLARYVSRPQEVQEPIRILYPALRHRPHRFQYGQVRRIQLTTETRESRPEARAMLRSL
jgi:hypothetical protein